MTTSGSLFAPFDEYSSSHDKSRLHHLGGSYPRLDYLAVKTMKVLQEIYSDENAQKYSSQESKPCARSFEVNLMENWRGSSLFINKFCSFGWHYVCNFTLWVRRRGRRWDETPDNKNDKHRFNLSTSSLSPRFCNDLLIFDICRGKGKMIYLISFSLTRWDVYAESSENGEIYISSCSKDK